MIIDCISDPHGFYPKLEGGDLLIVAGDLTARDTKEEFIGFGDWCAGQDYKKKIVICGNHDGQIKKIHDEFYKYPELINGPYNPFAIFGIEYLCDSGTEFEGLKIWGSPWTKAFPGMNRNCMAFTVDTEEELAEKWSLIPDDVDILVTHSPLVGFGDGVKDYHSGKIINVGSSSLKKRIWQMDTPPRLIVTGHIHEGYGIYKEKWHECSDDEFDQIIVNASHVDERYQPVNKPVRIEL